MPRGRTHRNGITATSLVIWFVMARKSTDAHAANAVQCTRVPMAGGSTAGSGVMSCASPTSLRWAHTVHTALAPQTTTKKPKAADHMSVCEPRVR